MVNAEREAIAARLLLRKAAEKVWEEHMTQRIISESLQIRKEWDESTRLARLVCKRLEWQVPGVRHAESLKGIDFS